MTKKKCFKALKNIENVLKNIKKFCKKILVHI